MADSKFVPFVKKEYLKVIRDEIKAVADEAETNDGAVRLSKVISLLRRINGLDRYFVMMSKVAPNEKERKAYEDLAKITKEIYDELNRVIMTSPGSKAVLSKHVRDKFKEVIGKLDGLMKESGNKYNLNVYVPQGFLEKRKSRSSKQTSTAQQANATQQALQQLQQTIAQAQVQAQEQMHAQKKSRKKKQEATVSA